MAENEKPTAKERDVVRLGDIFNWDPRGAAHNAIKYVLFPEAGKLFVNIVDYIARYLVYDSGGAKPMTSSNGSLYRNYTNYSDGNRVILKPKEDNRYDVSRIAIADRALIDDIFRDLCEVERGNSARLVTLYDFYNIVGGYLDGVKTQPNDYKFGWTRFSEKVDILSCPEGWYFKIPRPNQIT